MRREEGGGRSKRNEHKKEDDVERGKGTKQLSFTCACERQKKFSHCTREFLPCVCAKENMREQRRDVGEEDKEEGEKKKKREEEEAN